MPKITCNKLKCLYANISDYDGNGYVVCNGYGNTISYGYSNVMYVVIFGMTRALFS